jgi:murein DD-endopeptidase MepM/ murein hydrolase activator NlpD
MPRARRLLVVGVVAAALLGTGAPVSARDDRPTRPPSSTTTVPERPSGIDVGHGGDHAGARPPQDDIDVEPADPGNVNQVVEVSEAEAEGRRDAIRAELEALDARIARLEADGRAYRALAEDLVVEQRVVARRVVVARHRLVDRAVGAYVAGNAPEIEASFGATDPNDVEERATLVRTILEADQDEADRLLARRLEITARLSRVLEQAAENQARLRAARAQRPPIVARLEQARYVLKVFRAGSEIVITGFVFPVADPHTFSSTFGAPRSGGRSHQGADIFAPMGTPLVACERGVIARMGTGSLGGIKLWVVGESGTEYYYAHLIDYAPGITDGTRVEAGDVIGYVGNTGNAISTPPHLHFEIHPDGGDAIDPYPLLHAVDQVDGVNLLPPLGSGVGL